MSRRNSSTEAVHSQHTIDTSINSGGEQCTSKLLHICAYRSHLYLHWAFPGVTSAQPSPMSLYELFNRKKIGFTVKRDQTHCLPQLELHFSPVEFHTDSRNCKLERHRVQCQEPTLIQDDDMKMNSRPSFPLQLPIHCLWQTYGHAGICSKQILNLTKNKLMLTRWLFEPMQAEIQDWGIERSFAAN